MAAPVQLQLDFSAADSRALAKRSGDTDHTREYVPLLVWSGGAAGVGLGARDQYCDVAATIADGFDLEPFPVGVSFLPDITDHHS